MGRSNLALFGSPTVFDLIDARITQSAGLQIGFFALVMAALLGALGWFMRTELGLGLRGVGSNTTLAPALGLDVGRFTVAGLAIANGIAGLAGALVAQLQGYADVSMGFGVLVNGLAGLILGEAIIGRRGLGRQIVAPCLGALVYYQLVSLGLAMGLQPSDLRLVTGLFVVLTLALPVLAGRGRGVGEAM
jgi:putative ABC transport system permease protein